MRECFINSLEGLDNPILRNHFTNSKVNNEQKWNSLERFFKLSFYVFSKQVKQVLDEILEKLPDEFNVQEMMARVEDRTPYTVVAFQECERMNILTSEIKRSLKELDLGLKVRPASLKIYTPLYHRVSFDFGNG